MGVLRGRPYNPGMKDSSHGRPTLWTLTTEVPRRRPLSENADAAVCVIGAGFAGLHAAYFLAQAGRPVVVLDDGPVGAGESEATTAHLTAMLDRRWRELERRHGPAACRAAAESHARAIDAVESIAEQEGIDCGFERLDGYLLLAPGQELETLREELAAAKRCGIRDLHLVEKQPTPGFPAGPAIRVPRQAQCHPLRYLHGLAKAVERLGGRVYQGTHAASVEDGAPARVRTREGWTVTCESVIVATGAPVVDRVVLQTRIYPYRSYVATARVPAGSVHRGLYWDTADPYHYVRLAPGTEKGHDLLLVGGEDHKTGQADDAEARFARLGMWARERFPSIERMESGWSGQVLETSDGLAFIGRNPGQEHVFVVTGTSGNGTTYGALSGLMLADMVRGKRHPWAWTYRPSRPKARGAGDWLKENANAAAQYRRLVGAADAAGPEDIAPGEGAVLRRGLRKVAAYRDENGVLHERSAICPHLGGVVCWNHAEKSWDCPVHGSRFAANGEVLNGPANSDLPEVPETRPRRRRRAGRRGT